MNRHQSIQAIQLIAHRFAPFAAIDGPLSAGKIEIDGQDGTLYLSETRAWHFLADDLGDELEYDDTLSHKQVAQAIAPAIIIRRLLASMDQTIASYRKHLDRIEAMLQEPDALLSLYLGSLHRSVADALAI